MEAKILKQKGGSSCAIATCKNYYSKSKNDGRSNISFHRFPKDLKYRKEWIQKCKRGDHFNPDTSFICSDHFNVDTFVRDLKAELLGYAPKSRRLKEDAIIELNLPANLVSTAVESASTINRRNRMETKSLKQSVNIGLDYEQFYINLLKEYDILKTDYSVMEKEIASLKKSDTDNKNINESLRLSIKLVPMYKRYELDEIALQMGHEVIRLPPYHCQYNPIELIWAQVKAEVAKNNNTFKMADVEKLAHAAIDAVTQNDWENCVAHAEKIQNEDNEKEILRDISLEPIIITLQEDDSNWDDEENDDNIIDEEYVVFDPYMEAEECINLTLPSWLKIMSVINGYNNSTVIGSIDYKDIVNIQEFGRTTFPDVIKSIENEVKDKRKSSDINKINEAKRLCFEIMNNENDILEMLVEIDEEGISVSDDSYIDSDYDASERSDGNSLITDSDVDHTTTPSNSSDNNVSFNENAYLRPVSDTSVQSFSKIKVDINDDSSPIDVFFKIWDNDIFDLVLTCTNNCQKKINSLNRPHTKNGRMKNVSPLTRTDLEKFFDLCLLRGQLKLPVLRNAFSSNPLYYHPIFNATMSGRKFEKILRSLNCSEDFYELCSPDSYVLNIEIYKGKNVEVTGNSKINDLVLRLVKPYLNKGHHLYMDNYYNSVHLSNLLYKQRTHTTGTLQSNRKNNLTSIVKKTLKLKRGDHYFAKKEPIYVSRWKDKREVFSITNGHHPKMVITSNRFFQQQSLKPKHIVEYNRNMSGIDRSDQMIYLCGMHIIYIKKLNNVNLRYIDFHSSVIKKLLHLPDNIVHGSQLVKNKNIRIRTSNQPRNTSVVLEHVQEKIPHPPSWKRKGYYLRFRQFTSRKQVKQTSWRCKNCSEKPPLCPRP
ncbi:piggyBac transposable element-derived protein 4-like [Aphis craccivora]|uniref:PiggyBac transposable element-derived protein 4-like n=1 Tax=Aphis craccivora TaxID=307492 RepID=A0A6G0Y8Y0_APHCR|nr:piggyBac transposable element-derived protein 4-like [Aphis craccivora]